MAGNHDHTILITTDTVGGVWSFVVSLAEALAPTHSKIVIAALGPLPNKFQVNQIENLDHAILESFESKLEWMEDPWESINETGDWLKSLVYKYKPDVVHSNHYAHAGLDYNAPVVLTMHSCVKSWWRMVKKEEAPENWSRYGELVQNAIYSADKIVTPTKAILEAYKKEYAGLEDAQVIYNGIELNNYSSQEKEPFIFSMGRLWDEAKNINLLVEAAKQIDFPVYIAGKGEDKNAIPSNVHFLGWQSKDDIKELLSRASVYVLPVKYEPFGLSFLEAAASGCAIIGGKTSTLQEIWQDAALYAPQEEPEELATLINILMKDKSMLTEMSRRSELMSQKYSLSTTAKTYYQLYQSLNSILSTYEY